MLCYSNGTDKNNPITFHPDPFWYDVTLGFLEEHRPNKNKNNNNKMSSKLAIWDNFLIQQSMLINYLFTVEFFHNRLSRFWADFLETLLHKVVLLAVKLVLFEFSKMKF